MNIKEISIENFRGISRVNIPLSNKINVFVGINGSGKTTVLDAISISLSWLVNRIQREGSSGRPIVDTSIKNDTSNSSVTITVTESLETYSWMISRSAKGITSKAKSDLSDVSNLALHFQQILEKDSSLPVIAYYPINRVVNSTSPDISGKENLSILEVYDNALGGRTNYQSFFEWFRLQEDIVNERAQSRTKWMAQNSSLLKNKVKKLTSFANDLITNEGTDTEEKYYSQELIRRLTKDSYIYEEPRRLIHELNNFFRSIIFNQRRNYEYAESFRTIDHLFYIMGMLSENMRDDLIDSENFPISILADAMGLIERLIYIQEPASSKKTKLLFIWEALKFSVHITLWWIGNKGKQELDKLFNQFSPTKAKNASNWNEESKELIFRLNQLVINDVARLENATKNEGRELKYVTSTIEKFVSGYSNLRVTRIPRPQMLVDKDKVTINLDQLSDGEKNLIALVGDIARRLSIANPRSTKPLNGNGIILIDEIDLHLHASWQRIMIPQLTKLFPNCQFIITTHSPQVLSHVKARDVYMLINNGDSFSYTKPKESYGKTSDRILEDIMGVDARPKEEKQMIHDLFESIKEGNLSDARKKIDILLNLIGEDPEITKANVLIKRKEIIGK